MKKQIIFAGIALLLLGSCINRNATDNRPDVIDIAGSLQQTVKFKVSDFGKTIRYIPLETTDDCLIGNNPSIKVLKNHIIAVSGKECYLFNKSNGRFISQIGHVGDDPEGYTSPSCWSDEEESVLYFTRQPNKLIKYDMKGNYIGKVDLTTSSGLAGYFLFTHSSIIGYYNDLFKTENNMLMFFNTEGIAQDSIAPLLTPIKETMSDITDISVMKSVQLYGNWTESGVIFVNFKDDKKLVSAPSDPTLWKHNDKIRFKENFIDTIYTVNNKKLIPYIAFNTGNWHWPENERTSKEKNQNRIFVSYASENDHFIFFQCIQGLYTKNHVLYNGLYDKKTKETKLSESKEPIVDDLTNFVPFNQITVSTSGEFIGFIEAADVMEWKEENEAGENNELGFLKGFTEDMNPIVVIVE